MKLKFIVVAIATVLLSACQPAKEGKKNIVCTTSMIGDMVGNLLGDSVEVISLMGAGVDPHLYKPTSKDLSTLKGAGVILFNGLHLEGKTQEALEKLGVKKSVFAVADGIPESILRQTSEFKGNFDPHIWLDVDNWILCTKYVATQLTKEFPEHSDLIKENKDRYLLELVETDSLVQDYIYQIPFKSRYLVTAHDAFGYFGRAYGLKVKSLLGLSTLSEVGIKDVIDLSDFLKSNDIKSIFAETMVSNRSIRKVIETCEENGHQVKIGGNLFSDAMGEPGKPGGTYIGMLIHNAQTISENLK
jgi:manganese/zinc/iron transport system substrate-binding protein